MKHLKSVVVLLLLIASISIPKTMKAPILPDSHLDVKFDYYDLLVKEKERLAELRRYFTAISFSESSGDWTITHDGSKALGRYQFLPSTLRFLGFKGISYWEFKKNPDIFPEETQEQAMKALLKYNEKTLKKYINKYEGVEFAGIVITKSGILAAAHLAGAGGVMKFFRTGGKYNPDDGYTYLSDYLKEFSNYKVNLKSYV